MTTPSRVLPIPIDFAVSSSSDVTKRLASTTNLPAVIDLLPRSYQAPLGTILQDVYRVAVKAAGVQATLTAWKVHKNEKTVPPQVKGQVRDSRVQFSKEFRSSTAGKDAENRLTKQVMTARAQMLEKFIEEKESELGVLQEMIHFDADKWRSTVNQTADNTIVGFGGIRIEDGKGSKFDGVPDEFTKQYKLIHDQGQAFYHRAVELAFATVGRQTVDKTKKTSIVKATDVEMTGTDAPKSVETLVNEKTKSLTEKLDRLEKLLGKKSMDSLPLQPNGARSSLIHADPSSSKRKREQKVQPTCKEIQSRKKQRIEKVSTGQRQEVGKEVGRCLREKPQHFHILNPLSFPKAYFSASLNARRIFHFSQLSVYQADHWREAEPGIFKLPGLSLPYEIEYILSLNHKYVLRQELDFDLVKDAYLHFQRTVRTKWLFRNKEQNSKYIPRFHVRNATWYPPQAAKHIELGLKKGMELLRAQLNAIPENLVAQYHTIGWKKVHRFLHDNEILLKLTDKNLGLAALPKKWYQDEMDRLLSDTVTYERYKHTENSETWAQELKERIVKHARNMDLPNNYRKYVENSTKSNLPRFHIIPKVHKEPWKGRPIVPSHSWVTTCLSEIVDHTLQPILERLPWVVNSTKQVVQKLEPFRYSGQNVWLLTGDVEAFYTNVTWKDAEKMCRSAHRRFQPDHAISDKDLGSLIKIILKNNFFTANGVVYHQTQGIAMGTSCAPLLANIVAGFRERHSFLDSGGVPKDPRILTYFRYMDDVFALVKGTKEDVIDVSNNILKLDGFTITWSYSKERAVFLDLEVLHIPTIYGLELHTRVYRKPMNKYLYIPYSSAHPDAVKKGFVKAELTRYVTNCSAKRFFVETASQFRYNLWRRGYPLQILDQWMRQVSYSDRPALLEKRKTPSPTGPLMLPSQYNPVWEYINMKELTRAVWSEWSKDHLPEVLNQPVIKSLKRTMSLGDMMTLWNMAILS